MSDDRDARRYQWLREQVKTQNGRVLAQAMFWNNESRTQFDRAVDDAMRDDREKQAVPFIVTPWMPRYP